MFCSIDNHKKFWKYVITSSCVFNTADQIKHIFEAVVIQAEKHILRIRPWKKKKDPCKTGPGNFTQVRTDKYPNLRH